MSGPLRIGFAGAGTIARDRHVAGFRAIPGVELTAVANRSEASSRAAADEFGFERTARDWQALVDDPAIDAIVVGTWPYLHAEITVAALAAGKHVLSQARMALDAAEARRMVEAARAHRTLTTLLVPASHTYWVDTTIRRLLDEGAIGTPRTMVGAWNEPDVNDPGEWWRHQRRYSGHNIQGMGPLYEVFLRWVGEADAVTARTDLFEPRKPGPDSDIAADNPDHVSMLIEFPRGLAASIDVSSHSAAQAPSQVTIVGSDGALRVDLRARSLERRSPGPGGAWALVAIEPGDVEQWQVEEEFVGAIRGERNVRRNPFEVGLEYMTFSDAVVESAATGRRVRLERRGGR